MTCSFHYFLSISNILICFIIHSIYSVYLEPVLQVTNLLLVITIPYEFCMYLISYFLTHHLY